MDIRFAIIYYRTRAKVVDVGIFRNSEEIIEWFMGQSKLELTYILGIYDSSIKEEKERYERDLDKFWIQFKQDTEL